MGQLHSEFLAAGSTPIAVAVTGTFSQMAFGAKLGVDVPMLSDWDGDVADAYGVRYETWLGHTGVAKRSVFVIDETGIVRYRWLSEDALVVPDLTEALEVVRALASAS